MLFQRGKLYCQSRYIIEKFFSIIWTQNFTYIMRTFPNQSSHTSLMCFNEGWVLHVRVIADIRAKDMLCCSFLNTKCLLQVFQFNTFLVKRIHNYVPNIINVFLIPPIILSRTVGLYLSYLVKIDHFRPSLNLILYILLKWSEIKSSYIWKLILSTAKIYELVCVIYYLKSHGIYEYKYYSLLVCDLFSLVLKISFLRLKV